MTSSNRRQWNRTPAEIALIRRRRVLDLMEKNPYGITFGSIRDEFGGSYEEADDLLQSLLAGGLVEVSNPREEIRLYRLKVRRR